MRITRLATQSIGPFENFSIDFKLKPKEVENKAEINILTGENGTGKTTILMMLAAFFDERNYPFASNQKIGVTALKKRIKNERSYFTCNFDDEYSPHETFNLLFHNNVVQIDRSEDGDIYRYARKVNGFDKNQKFRFAVFSYSGSRTINQPQSIEIQEVAKKPLKNAVDFQTSINIDLIFQYITGLKVRESIAIADKNSQKASELKNKIELIEKSISKIINKNVEFRLNYETANIQLMFFVENKLLDFDVLPDGLKSIISWLSDLLVRLDQIEWEDESKSILEQNFILFLDEIEVHLHPSWQRKILPVVQDLFPNAQIFISTHSPFVVGSVDGARVYKFKLDENNNSVLDSEYWTEDGNSYQYYLREVFDIKNEFGVKIDESLQELQRLKEKALKGSAEDYEKFMVLTDKLLNENPNSVELSSIVGFERRKLEKQFPTQPVTA